MVTQIAILLKSTNSINRNTLKAGWVRVRNVLASFDEVPKDPTQGQKSPAMGIQIALLLNTKNSLNRNTLKATMNRGGSGSAMSWLLWMKSQKTQGQRSPAMVTQIVILVNTTNIKAHRNTFFGLIYSILVPINHHHHHHQSQHHLLEIFWKWTTISNFSDVFIRQKSNKHLIRSSFIPLSTLLIPSQK